MALGRGEIEELVDGERLIEQFSKECLGGAGYDLRIGRIYKLITGGSLGKSDRKTPEVEEFLEEKIELEPNEYVLVESLEKVNMPANIMARILPRSTVFRCGCSLITAVIDPGFKGTLTMGLKNLSAQTFTLEKGARIGQIVFEEVTGTTTLYEGKYQGGRVV
ncbi:dCTP deaminase [Candidatus Altiarchaeota archaeon]